jgi:hypothetical protein
MGLGGTPGGAPGVGGSGLIPIGDGGAVGDGGVDTGGVGPGGAGGMPSIIPPTDDYSTNGPFTPRTVNNTGPNGQYTLVRPTTLGENGFLHPVATWGNGISTTPALYPGLLNAIASHGFVVIASNSTNVTAQLMTQGLDWMIAQNDTPGDYQGKLDPDRAVTIGYSLGGGASVGSGSHPKVVATVSFHGLQGPAENLSGPLLLFTSTADGFVTKAGYVQPCYNRSSKVPTIMATLNVNAPADFLGHLYPLGDAGDQRAPAIAWLRYWVYGDQGGRKYFYGTDCLLCQSPWTDIQRKNADWN